MDFLVTYIHFAANKTYGNVQLRVMAITEFKLHTTFSSRQTSGLKTAYELFYNLTFSKSPEESRRDKKRETVFCDATNRQVVPLQKTVHLPLCLTLMAAVDMLQIATADHRGPEANGDNKV